ncbi:hypertrehalosaemic prohormone [Hetaerina americana]|uniref:hypertrehalosaemic prohormone n=1 Tax=Hetaerina americana TaxID=62018 RepID=UPI003A7F2705
MQHRSALALLALALLLVALVHRTTAQVNFTPGWGKRGGLEAAASCKPSMESIMYLYKLIQGEAQKLVDCDKFTN